MYIVIEEAGQVEVEKYLYIFSEIKEKSVIKKLNFIRY